MLRIGQGAVAAALLVFLLRRVDWPAMAELLGDLRLGSLALAVLAFGAIAALEAVRLGVALDFLALGARRLLRLHLVGLFVGNFMPGQIGGDLFRLLDLRASTRELARPAALILAVRALGFAVLAIGALIGLLVNGRQLAASLRWEPPGAAAGLLTATALALLLLLAAHPRIRRWLGERRAALATWAGETLATLRAVRWGTLVWLSVAVLLARLLVLHFLVRAVGAGVGGWEALLVVSLASLVTVLPISLAGLGVRETAVSFLLVEFDVPYEEALLVALLGRLLILLLSLPGGLWLIHDAGGERSR